MGYLLILTVILTLFNLIIMTIVNVRNIIENIKWDKKRKELDEEFEKVLNDMIASHKCECKCEKTEEE